MNALRALPAYQMLYGRADPGPRHDRRECHATDIRMKRVTTPWYTVTACVYCRYLSPNLQSLYTFDSKAAPIHHQSPKVLEPETDHPNFKHPATLVRQRPFH